MGSPLKIPDMMMSEVPPGWETIVRKALLKLASLEEGIKILQVKEKFGALRVYYMPYSEHADEIIREAEQECSQACDVCGQSGTRTYGTWIRVLCDNHRKEFDNVDEDR